MKEQNNRIVRKEKYNIAGLKVLMTTYYEETYKRAEKYIAKDENWDEKEADIVIDLGNETYEKIYDEYMPYLNCEAIEYIYTGSYFHHLLLKYNGCMLHSSGVVVDGYAYLFSANSGTGKSTHTGLWLEHFKDKAYIINDDKPVLKKENDSWYVYGTPWSGKYDINANKKELLGGIVFLERSKTNYIEPLQVKDAIPLFYNQTVKSFKKVENIELVLKTLEQVLTENPIYKMGCDISDSAVEMAYNTIKITEARMKIKKGFILRNVAGNNVVVPVGEATIDFNGMMSLNETGAFLFEKMIEGTTKEQLIEQLMSQYEIDADTAKNDVEEFIEKVKKENLFE